MGVGCTWLTWVVRSGVDGGEKDVDIDDDMAPTKFAPVVIDKGRDSSSSDSDSDSSGSDSGKWGCGWFAGHCEECCSHGGERLVMAVSGLSDMGWGGADSDSGSSSGSDSDPEDGQTGGGGPKASHDKV